jgi:hypothetical protein
MTFKPKETASASETLLAYALFKMVADDSGDPVELSKEAGRLLEVCGWVTPVPPTPAQEN